MEFEEEEEKSRSQKKRDYDEVKNLVGQLIELGSRQLSHIPLSDSVRAEILDAQKMKKSSLKRQQRFIASRMDTEDMQAIRAALAEGPQQISTEEDVPDDAERWGSELISKDDQFLGEFVDQHPEVDRQRLRQFVRNARKERDRGKAGKSAGLLVEYLKSVNLKS